MAFVLVGCKTRALSFTCSSIEQLQPDVMWRIQAKMKVCKIGRMLDAKGQG